MYFGAEGLELLQSQCSNYVRQILPLPHIEDCIDRIEVCHMLKVH